MHTVILAPWEAEAGECQVRAQPEQFNKTSVLNEKKGQECSSMRRSWVQTPVPPQTHTHKKTLYILWAWSRNWMHCSKPHTPKRANLRGVNKRRKFNTFQIKLNLASFYKAVCGQLTYRTHMGMGRRGCSLITQSLIFCKTGRMILVGSKPIFPPHWGLPCCGCQLPHTALVHRWRAEFPGPCQLWHMCPPGVARCRSITTLLLGSSMNGCPQTCNGCVLLLCICNFGSTLGIS